MVFLISAAAQSENYINVYFHFPRYNRERDKLVNGHLFSMQIAGESN